MKKNYSLLIAGPVFLIGVAIIAFSLFRHLGELQIALLLSGIGFVITGVVLWAQVNDREQDEEKHQQIMEKLEKIEQDLEKLEKPQNTGVAIADVISSGLKYYAEHMNRPKKEDEND